MEKQNKAKLLTKYQTQTELLKEVLKYLNGRYVRLVGMLVDLNIFLSSPSRKVLIFSKDVGLWKISVTNEF
jgi:hypothetical protein